MSGQAWAVAAIVAGAVVLAAAAYAIAAVLSGRVRSR